MKLIKKFKRNYHLRKHRNSQFHKGNVVNFTVKQFDLINAKGGKLLWRCSYCSMPAYEEKA